MNFHYYNSAGKKITRDLTPPLLQSSTHVQIEAGTKSLKILRNDGKYHCRCDEHNAQCDMDKPLSAIEWAENHLRQFHS